MNKKFFAALTSAAMLLSSTGVVLANDFVEVPESTSGVPGADAATDLMNNTTFPDKNFQQVIKTKLNGKAPTKANLEGITSLTIASADNVSDLTGIEYLTGLETLVINTTGNNIDTVDLSANTALTSVAIGPTVTVPASGAPTTNASTTTTDSVESVVLPETETLSTVVIEGNDSLTSLDVTGLPALGTLNVAYNDLADIDLSNNFMLTTADFSNNSLNKLDVSKNINLKDVTATNNSIDDIKASAGVLSLDLANNKLENLDASGYKKLATLKVNGNMLSSLLVPSSLTLLDCANNHLATLDLSKVNGLSSSVNVAPTTAGQARISPQTVYSNPENKAVNMAEYDENYKESGVGTATNATKDGNILTFTKSLGDLEFVTGAATIPSYTWKTGAPATDNTVDTAEPMTVNIIAADLMNRLYNPNSGEHFYTKDIEEKDTLVSLGWQAEGIGWIAPAEKDTSKAKAPVFRLYNPNAGDHHYTTNANERDTLVTKGWKNEGIGWYSAEGAKAEAPTTPAAPTTIEVFREYNPNAKEAGAHNYTISGNENDTLVSLGWLDEGIGWWALK